ncbi:uncharacterized protein LOC129592358 [Paramacrobiotus metropolitanus]|uniref:uncharacterized protein LOC129592358 n=1 Tax=Paramacrobiotus metropolitanus TaxID=2943436 RepID=UPI002445C0DC|nr:uncharacterized protein LOC129592358 [Paramacrobiotus metropolitanus]
MLCLRGQNAAPLTCKDVEDAYVLAKYEVHKAVHSSAVAYVLRQIVMGNTSKKRKTPGNRQSLPLPVELMVEIFQTLDSIGRVRCRRVCALWNSILTTDTYFPDVRVSHWSSESADLPSLPDMFWVVASLLKCLNRATTTLMITGVGFLECRKLSALVRHLLAGRRLRTLVFFQCRFSVFDTEERDVLFEQSVGRLTRLAGDFAVDRRMVWKQCRVVSSLEAVVEQHVFSVQPREAMAVQVWEVFEAGLVLQRPLDRQAVKDWIAACIVDHSDSEIEDMVMAVNNYQSADPRPGTLHRGRLWTAADIGQLDVGQLSVLTVASLGAGFDSSLANAERAQLSADVDPFGDLLRGLLDADYLPSP